MAKRKRRTVAEMAALRARILEFLQEHHPASARNLFYRLVQDGIIEKTEKAYQNLIKLLVRMRRGGQLPYQFLADASRVGYHVYASRDTGAFVIDAAPTYRWDMWSGEPVRVEIWCESAALLTVLQPVHKELAVSLFPCRGYSSITFAFEAAQYAKRVRPSELVVIYVGDYDHDGRLIDRALLRELRHHVDDRFPVTERRVAVNEDQIAEYELPTRPDRKGADSVQAEALPPNLLRDLVRNAIVGEYLPPWKLLHAEKQTEAGRETARLIGRALLKGTLAVEDGEVVQYEL